jgi:hemolysin III
VSGPQTIKAWVQPIGADRQQRSVLPRWRGRSHQLALLVSIPAGVLLIRHAQAGTAKLASAIYVASLVGLFLSSSVYNRFLGTDRLRPWMQWVDHAMIYGLIAGSYTPTCLVTLPRPVGIILLVVVWTASLVGAFSKFVLKHRFRVAGGVLYSLVGCAVLAAMPQLIRSATPTVVVLYVIGGIFYGLGGLSLYRRRPDPSPNLFGYHEVWHLYVVAGAAAHFAANWLSVS